MNYKLFCCRMAASASILESKLCRSQWWISAWSHRCGCRNDVNYKLFCCRMAASASILEGAPARAPETVRPVDGWLTQRAS